MSKPGTGEFIPGRRVVRIMTMTAVCAVVGAFAAGTTADAAETVAWQPGVSQAQAVAAQQSRPMLIFVTSSSCGYCTKMKRDSLANENVVSMINGSFVPLKLDANRDRRLVEQLRVDAFPTTFVVAPDGRVVDRDSRIPSREAVLAAFGRRRTAAGPASFRRQHVTIAGTVV